MKGIVLTVLLLSLILNFQSLNAHDPLITIMENELSREMSRLKEENYPPYYIDYRIDEIHSNTIESIFGSLTRSDSFKGRFITVTVKVGDYELDNTHSLKSGFNINNSGHSFGTVIPFEDDDDAIRQVIWRITDLAYKNAVSSYIIIKNEIKKDSTDNIPDFSKETPVSYFDTAMYMIENVFKQEEWEDRTRDFSKIFLKEMSIIEGKARVNYYREKKYFVSSEGSKITQNKTYARLQLAGKIKAEDESVLPLYKSYYSFKPAGLPGDEEITEDIKKMVDKLIELKDAAIAEPYAGPTILSPGAAGVFFHEIFGHRIEGHRLKNITDGQTFKDKLGIKVLPDFIDVICDPEMASFNGQDLFGSYKYDDQGVKSSKVKVVDQGILSRFLMSRTPLDIISHSNGHGRAQAGMHPVSRQSNMLVTTSNPLTDKDLRKLLIKECKKQKKEYGYFFKDVIGGFTITNRYSPNVFNIIPTEVYRIYVDGRPDELVRGVELIGTPLLMFSEIEATGDTSEVFTGFCGAESGNIPVTAISPALFVKKIETQKKPEETGQLPVLPRPDLHQENKEGNIMKAMHDELQRNMLNIRHKECKKPFFISYSIEDINTLFINATMGAISASNLTHNRGWSIRVMVGDYQLTDENFEEAVNSSQDYTQYLDLPVDNDYCGVRRFLWEATDGVYKSAAQTYKNKIATLSEKNIAPEDLPVADFSRAPVIKKHIPGSKSDFDRARYENIARELSSLFKNSADIFYSDVSIILINAVAYFINSEGTETQRPLVLSAIAVNSQTMDEFSEIIADQVLYYYRDPHDLPDLESMKADVERMKDNIIALRNAKVFDDTYFGPALITDQAVAQILAGSLFTGPGNLIAYREPLYSDAQMSMYYGQRSFSNESKIDKRIMSRDISVVSLPGLKDYNGNNLIGSFEFDAEGVIPPEELVLVEDGILKTLLSSRIPTKKISESNGHNRYAMINGAFTKQVGPGVVRVSSSTGKSREELKKDLINMAIEEGLDYTIIIRPVSPGINYRPVNIYKVSVPDGSEELIRSVNMGGITINSLKRIYGISDNEIVYNTIIPEDISGGVMNSFRSGSGIADGLPVSLIVPDALILEEIEMEGIERPLSNNLPVVDNPSGK